MYGFTIFTLFSVGLPFALAKPVSNATLEKRNTYTGRGTWFNDGLGACGWTNTDSDTIVALSTGLYGNGGYCGSWVTITNTANGATVGAYVADKCPSCGQYDLDMSIGTFQQIGDLGTGVLSISWYFD